MLETPEVIIIASQINQMLVGKTIQAVLPPTKEHKFCWFYGDPNDYHQKLYSSTITNCEGFGLFVQINFDNGYKLCFHDGVNARLVDEEEQCKQYQLMLVFEQGGALVFTVAMYGGLYLFSGELENEYYHKSRVGISPLSHEFAKYYNEQFALCEQTSLSVKAFLATQQRFVGIGNGTIQDIMFKTGLNPKRKLKTLSENHKKGLLQGIVTVVRQMTELGGRDTEKDLFGNRGGYVTLMSKNAVSGGCPCCGSKIVKEAYLGGSVYYCPVCQPLC